MVKKASMTRKKTVNWHPILRIVINRRSNDAIAFHILFIPLSKLLNRKSMSNSEKWLNRIITVATALLAMLNYILAHLPKSLILAFAFTGLTCTAQVNLKCYPFQIKPEIQIADVIVKGPPITPRHGIIMPDTIIYPSKDSSLWFAPSIAFNVWSRNMTTGTSEYGLIPGIGYGLKWNPYKWFDSYLIAIDLFVNAGYKELGNEKGSYYILQIAPTLTLVKYLHIGIGYNWAIAVGSQNNNSYWVVNTGISLPIL